MTMPRILKEICLLRFALTSVLVLLAGCAGTLSPAAHREARLMPPEVAKKIISRWTGSAWVENPVAPYSFGNVLDSRRTYCDTDQSPQPMPFREMTITYHGDRVMIRRSQGVCKVQEMVLNARLEQDRNDLIDAFVSLGATTLVKESADLYPQLK